MLLSFRTIIATNCHQPLIGELIRYQGYEAITLIYNVYKSSAGEPFKLLLQTQWVTW